MGTSKSFAELGKKLEASARAIETKSDVEVTAESAFRAKKVILAHMRVAAPRLTLNAGKKGKTKKQRKQAATRQPSAE